MHRAYEVFLTDLGAKAAKHSGRTLYDHLRGTYEILKAWKCPVPVCEAGLFHSIYGTEYYSYSCLKLDQRELLRNLIGYEAEQLAYEFCTTPRDRLASKELLAIAAANQLEQNFERCWPWLEKALEYFAYVDDRAYIGRVIWPTHRKEHILAGILSGKFFFWPGKKCAIVSLINESPTGLRTQTNWLVGGDPNESLDEIKKLIKVVENFGRHRGCHREASNGRLGWAKALDGYEIRGGIRKYKDLLKEENGPPER